MSILLKDPVIIAFVGIDKCHPFQKIIFHSSEIAPEKTCCDEV